MATLQGFRLSPRQARLWRMRDETALRSQSVLEILGLLDTERLRTSLEEVVGRHEILRTCFLESPGVPLPVQSVAGSPGFSWEQVDARPGDEAEERVREVVDAEWDRRFDLAAGGPLHVVLVRTGEERHFLVLTLPALVADRRSLDNVEREIAESYGRSVPPEGEAVQYFQYSEWHHALLAEKGEEGAEHWRERFPAGLDGSPSLPGVEPRKPDGRFDPRRIVLDLDETLSATLTDVARRLATDDMDILLAVWQALVARLGDRSELPVGLVLDGRSFEEILGGVGVFAAVVPFGFTLAADLSLAEAVATTRRRRLEGEEWQELFVGQGGRATERPATAASALFEAASPAVPRRAGGVLFSRWTQRAYVDRFSIALVHAPMEERRQLELHYDAACLEADAALRMARRFEALLGRALEAPGEPLVDLEMLGEMERRWLIEELNDTRREVPTACVHELFEAQATRAPDATAVRYGEEELSFREIDARADRLAGELRARGVGPEVIVALLMEPTPEVLVAILAVLKAGGAYLPLDAASPAGRLGIILADAKPRLILADHLAERLPAGDVEVLRLEAGSGEVGPGAPGGLTVPVAADNLAYVIYTSGSTGTPKGVQVTHRGLRNYVCWAVRQYEMEAGCGAPVDTPLSFDLTVTSLFTPLLAGRTVFLQPQPADGATRGNGEGEPFSLRKMTPAHLELLGQGFGPRTAVDAARVLVVGGEALSGGQLAAWRRSSPSTRFVNEYGPTETVVGCCFYEVPPEAPLDGPVPIGRPVANTCLLVLDGGMRLLAAGMTGELFIAGEGLARGYCNRPRQTAERFLPDPTGRVPGGRVYRSGDLVRHRSTGDLVFVGRVDHQVKVHGFRIELGEVEAALVACPGVREAVAIVREDSPGDRRLVAYVVPEEGRAPTLEEMRSWLAARLPEYMVPAAFVSLEALPLTSHGKVDRSALGAPGSGRPELRSPYVAPRSPVEEILATIWSESLGIERIGIYDNFFVLGGDSMRSVRIVSLARDRGLDLTVHDLFRHPTIAALADELEEGLGLDATRSSEAAEAREVDGDGDLEEMVEQLEGLSEEEVLALLKDKRSQGHQGA